MAGYGEMAVPTRSHSFYHHICSAFETESVVTLWISEVYVRVSGSKNVHSIVPRLRTQGGSLAIPLTRSALLPLSPRNVDPPTELLFFMLFHSGSCSYHAGDMTDDPSWEDLLYR